MLTSLLSKVTRYRNVGFLLLLFSSTSYTQTINRLSEGFPESEGQTITIALFEPFFQMERILAGGTAEIRADWTDSASKNFREILFKAADKQSINFVDANITSDIANGRARQVEKLNQVVGLSIIDNSILKLPSKGDGKSWTIGEGAKLIGEHTHADYGLYVYKKRGYTTGGRVAVSILTAAVLGVAAPTHYQFGFASLVDLNTGEIVYFNQVVTSPGDLRKVEKSGPAVKALLTGFPELKFPEEIKPAKNPDREG